MADVIYKTEKSASGKTVFRKGILSHIVVDEAETQTLAQGGVIKREYLPHDITVLKCCSGQDPNPASYEINDRYYNPRTKKVAVVWSNSGTKEWSSNDPGTDRLFLDLSTGNLLHFHDSDMYMENGVERILEMASSAPATTTLAEGARYYNTSTKKIMSLWKNASGTLEWMNPQTPRTDFLYLVMSTATVMYWGGSGLGLQSLTDNTGSGEPGSSSMEFSPYGNEVYPDPSTWT